MSLASANTIVRILFKTNGGGVFRPIDVHYQGTNGNESTVYYPKSQNSAQIMFNNINSNYCRFSFRFWRP